MTAQFMPPPGASRTIYELSKEAHDGLHFSPRYALDTSVHRCLSLPNRGKLGEAYIVSIVV